MSWLFLFDLRDVLLLRSLRYIRAHHVKFCLAMSMRSVAPESLYSLPSALQSVTSFLNAWTSNSDSVAATFSYRCACNAFLSSSVRCRSDPRSQCDPLGEVLPSVHPLSNKMPIKSTNSPSDILEVDGNVGIISRPKSERGCLLDSKLPKILEGKPPFGSRGTPLSVSDSKEERNRLSSPSSTSCFASSASSTTSSASSTSCQPA